MQDALFEGALPSREQIETALPQHSSASIEWYTPPEYVEAAREVMGGIDLDPATCPEANQWIRAEMIYTQENDGLQHDWHGRIWLNPPYGKEGNQSNQDRWSGHLIRQYELGNVWQAVMLVNAVPGNKWFARLWAFPICFTDHRIRFISAGETDQPTHSNAFVYLGPNVAEFRRVFERFGVVVEAKAAA